MEHEPAAPRPAMTVAWKEAYYDEGCLPTQLAMLLERARYDDASSLFPRWSISCCDAAVSSPVNKRVSPGGRTFSNLTHVSKILKELVPIYNCATH
jgi:hypothetical protein